MGVLAVTDYIRKGSIDVANYPKYIIPYTPICIALIIAAALMPVILRFFKRFALPVISLLGVGVFLISEILLENMVIMTSITRVKLESWQLMMCIATPEVFETVRNPLVGEYSPAFKIHFYIISIVVILAVINVIYGFAKMIAENNYRKIKPLIAQAISAVIFIGLCIFACFTAFFRKGNINISPISAFLMTIFFIVFGVTAGVYIGTSFYGKKKLWSTIIPSIFAVFTTFVMYAGELVLMGGKLFKFGSGFLFESLGVIPFSIIDIAIILSSGALTYIILNNIKEYGEDSRDGSGDLQNP
jgi:hypothetical protein